MILARAVRVSSPTSGCTKLMVQLDLIAVGGGDTNGLTVPRIVPMSFWYTERSIQTVWRVGDGEHRCSAATVSPMVMCRSMTVPSNGAVKR